MSNLSKALTSHFTGSVKPVPKNLAAAYLEVSTNSRVMDHDLSYAVEMSAKFSQKYYVRHRESLDYPHNYPLEKKLKRAIIESVFGEFRQNINNVRVALMELDEQKAHEELDKLESSMFDIE
jgi:hypothetical protein